MPQPYIANITGIKPNVIAVATLGKLGALDLVTEIMRGGCVM
jgi:hypothetical protein